MFFQRLKLVSDKFKDFRNSIKWVIFNDMGFDVLKWPQKGLLKCEYSLFIYIQSCSEDARLHLK